MNKVITCFLIGILFLFIGYFWRMYHEVKNWDKWQQRIVKEFLYEIEKEERQVFQVHDWTFVKRADGSIVLRRR